jgi:hypothetical protein
VDALSGWESAAAETVSKRMDMRGQKTTRTELELRRSSACGCRPPSSCRTRATCALLVKAAVS